MILCIGETCMDMVSIPDPDLASGSGAAVFRPVPGGSAFNTALAVARLGYRVGLGTGLSSDLFGKSLRQAMARNTISELFSVEKESPTMLSFAETLDDGQPRYHFFDKESASHQLAPADIPSPLPVCPEILHISCGTLGKTPHGETCLEYARRCAAAGTGLIVVDPNIRPLLVEDRRLYTERLTQLIGRADIVKLSLEDLDWLGMTWSQVCRDWHACGVVLVVLTQGGCGLSASLKGSPPFHLPVEAMPAARFVDGIGAGDTLSGALWVGLAERGLHQGGALARLSAADSTDSADSPNLTELVEALSFAQRAAAVTVTRVGADPPRREDL